MNKHVPNERYMQAAEEILNSLIDKYMTDKITSTGLLTDGMYARMRGDRPECNIWGDYYFMEALVRIVSGGEWKSIGKIKYLSSIFIITMNMLFKRYSYRIYYRRT